MNRILIIGHRGTGKTTLLERLRQYYSVENKAVLILDLDQEISQQTQKKITDIFESFGEAHFRNLELETLNRLIQNHNSFPGDIYIATGAGFQGATPSGWKKLWVCRSTDGQGRVFTDRPRLNADLNPLDEYLERYRQRQNKFQLEADLVLNIPEGFDFPNTFERDFFLGGIKNIGGAVTLLPKSPQQINTKFNSLLDMNFQWVEFRDDLISSELRSKLSPVPKGKIIFSFRDPLQFETSVQWTEFFKPHHIDWANELGDVPSQVHPTILSFHDRGPEESLENVLVRIDSAINKSESTKSCLAKMAVPIYNFSELKKGHQWFMENPTRRSFLPSSREGRWSWYRLMMKEKLPINFIREDQGSSPDQPIFLEWLRQKSVKNFAAILGDPVNHSRTPGEQYQFFSNLNLNIFSISISKEDFNAGGFEFLQDLGLKAAAVTSPLKELAFLKTKFHTPIAMELKSVNTLYDSKAGWHGTNTDLEGLKKMLTQVESAEGIDLQKKAVAIWGGGGVLSTLAELLPNSHSFSARTGVSRDNSDFSENESPDVLVWSIGRSQWEKAGRIFPAENWHPEIIIDLNYSEDSPGREYAQKIKSKYVSGLMMFKFQAEGQRKFWTEKFQEVI